MLINGQNCVSFVFLFVFCESIIKEKQTEKSEQNNELLGKLLTVRHKKMFNLLKKPMHYFTEETTPLWTPAN